MTTVPDFASWLSGPSFSDSASRAVLAWNRIQDRPTSVVLIRNGTKQAAQTVRVEINPSGGETRQGNAQLGTVGVQSVTVFGVRSHPTITDTDIQRKDRFVWGGKEYAVTGVVPYPGEIQAFGEARE